MAAHRITKEKIREVIKDVLATLFAVELTWRSARSFLAANSETDSVIFRSGAVTLSIAVYIDGILNDLI